MGESTQTDSTLSLDSLERALREVEPSVMLLPTWLLENVIAADRAIRGPLFSIPHDQSHVIERDRLLQIAADEDLPLPEDPPDQPVLLLLNRPDSDWVASTSPEQVRLAYWRVLFHGRIDSLLRSKRVAGELNDRAVQDRIERLGRSAFREAVFVLQKERQLASGADDAEAYAEFAAAYLELLHFEPWMLHWYFPAADADRVLPVLSEDIDPKGVLADTRLDGAADPAHGPAGAHDDHDDAPSEFRPAPPSNETAPPKERDPRRGAALVRQAESAEKLGNDVRSAIQRTRAARFLRGEAGTHRNVAASRLDSLAKRLCKALDLDASDYAPWRAILRGLLAHADVGWWNNERRLLYDLQKACVCHEREAYSANVVEWVLDRGRRPLRRPQPAQRLVTAHKSLKSAERRAAKVRLQPHDHAALRRLLHAAVTKAEDRLRAHLRPAIIQALEEGNLAPVGAVETVAEEKLVDELLDDVTRRGYLNLGNLRDAVSRNQLKLNDLSGPREFFGRDQLLRADRRLEFALDGVYHRGEVYLRLFQRLSSVLFGTIVGRFLTRMLLIPLLGSYIVLEGLDHSVGSALTKLAHWHVHFTSKTSLALLALFIACLLNWPAFRAAAARGGRTIWHGLKAVFLDLPKWVGHLPAIRFLYDSQAFRVVFRYAIKPLAIAAIALPLLPDGTLPASRATVLVIVYLIAAMLLNSPPGRAFEQTLLHALRVTVPRMTWDILTGMFRLVMNAFDRLLESVDRALYAVDEWLRFGGAQGKLSIAVKAALGVVWYYVAYVTRFVVNLLVEPQINPIKHFPVVTVSHKIMIPVTPALAKGFVIAGMAEGTAWTLAGGIITGTPGIFGFLAWELKENWKLYRRNRPQTLRPVRVGSHGETFAQLLRPGFHSGTLPKLFARVRKSAGHARSRGGIPLPGTGGPRRKDREAAHHVREDVCVFVERELVSLLNHHPLWAATPTAVGEVELAATRVRIELRCDALSPEPAVLTFDHRDGFILAAIESPAWMTKLTDTQAELLRTALVGFYKLAAVDLVAEHVKAAFAPATVRFDIRKRKLVVWTGDDFAHEMSYDLAKADDAEVKRLTLQHADVPWPLWRKVWDLTAETEIVEVTGQIAPDVETLSEGCLRQCNRATRTMGSFPAITPVQTASSLDPATQGAS